MEDCGIAASAAAAADIFGPRRGRRRLAFVLAGVRLCGADYRVRTGGRGDFRSGLQRRILHRDLAAESSGICCVSWDSESTRRGRTKVRHIASCPAPKLPNAVRALTAQQWHVEGERKIYRQPGKIEMKKSGYHLLVRAGRQCGFRGRAVKLPALLQAISKGESTVVLDDGTVGILPNEWLKRYSGCWRLLRM